MHFKNSSLTHQEFVPRPPPTHEEMKSYHMKALTSALKPPSPAFAFVFLRNETHLQASSSVT